MRASRRSKKQNRTMPLIVIAIGVLLILSVIIILALNAPTTSAPQSSSLDIPLPNISRVSVEDARQAYDSESAVFLDIRDSGSFAAGRVAGALNIPLAELESRMDELPKDRWIITYCT